MITEHHYSDHGKYRHAVKNRIKQNKYSCIDIGGSMDFWSYPECTAMADLLQNADVSVYFRIDLNNNNTWHDLLDHVKRNGKFDFSICSHTLEDILHPIEVCKLLETVSRSGYIAIPSKQSEFTRSRGRRYRGEGHHKNILDINKDNVILVYPKFSWTETHELSDKISQKNIGSELSVFWEKDIPIKYFDEGHVFRNDQMLIQHYYNSMERI